MSVNFLDDDTDIFEGHPIKRFFKMRKWFAFVSFVLLLLHNNWLDYESLASLLRITGLPKQEFIRIVTVAGIYFLLQSTLLILQITTTYSESISGRSNLIYGARLDGLRSNTNEARDRLSNAEQELKKLKQQYPDGKFPENKAFELRDREERLYAEVHNLEKIADEAERDYMTFLYNNEKKRERIEFSELVLDFVRIVPIYLFMIYSVLFYGYLL